MTVRSAVFTSLLGLTACVGHVLELPDPAGDDREPTLDRGPHQGVTWPDVVYLNGRGGEYTRGPDASARANVSSVAAGTARAYAGGAQRWSDIVSCVRARFAPLPLEVTDVDPGARPHVEAVVGGSPSDLGMPGNSGGAATVRCSAVPEDVVFVFSAAYGDDVSATCEAIAHEVGHVYGLDHATLPSDLMSYSGMHDRRFEEDASACGEREPRPCVCGGAAQSSFVHLSETVGTVAAEPPRAPAHVRRSTPAGGAVTSHASLCSLHIQPRTGS